jgi:outer membrane protein OmpA-like peptidoglycan-associated protein
MRKSRAFIRLLTSAALFGSAIPVVAAHAGNSLPSVEVHIEGLNFLRAKQKRLLQAQAAVSSNIPMTAPTELAAVPALVDAMPVDMAPATPVLEPTTKMLEPEVALPPTASRIDLRTATISRAQVDAIAASTPVTSPAVTPVHKAAPVNQAATKTKSTEMVAPTVTQGSVKIRRPESLPLRPHADNSGGVQAVEVSPAEAPVAPSHVELVAKVPPVAKVETAKTVKSKKTKSTAKSPISERPLHDLPQAVEGQHVRDEPIQEHVNVMAPPVAVMPEATHQQHPDMMTPPPMAVPPAEQHTSALATPEMLPPAGLPPAQVYDPHEDVVPPALAPMPPSIEVPSPAPIAELPALPPISPNVKQEGSESVTTKPSYWERTKALFTRNKAAAKDDKEVAEPEKAPLPAPAPLLMPPPADHLTPPGLPPMPAPAVDRPTDLPLAIPQMSPAPSAPVPTPPLSMPEPHPAPLYPTVTAAEPLHVIPEVVPAPVLEVQAMPVPEVKVLEAQPIADEPEPRLLQPEVIATPVAPVMPSPGAPNHVTPEKAPSSAEVPATSLGVLTVPAQETTTVPPAPASVLATPLPAEPVTAMPAVSGLPKLVFEPTATALSPTLKGHIDAMLVHLKLVSGERLRITGYATAGMQAESEDQARRTSLQRVIAVRKYLIEKGFDAMQLNLQALGTSVPGKGDIVEFSVVANQ